MFCGVTTKSLVGIIDEWRKVFVELVLLRFHAVIVESFLCFALNYEISFMNLEYYIIIALGAFILVMNNLKLLYECVLV